MNQKIAEAYFNNNNELAKEILVTCKQTEDYISGRFG
jgi:hypothetical protein